MKFIIAIEPGTETAAFGVVVPDLPGCFSAGDTLDKAVDNAREAIELWCQTVIEDGGDVPTAKALAEHQAGPDFAGWTWTEVEVPVERFFGTVEKLIINEQDKQMNDREKLNAVPIIHGEGWQLVMIKDIPIEYRQLFLRDMVGENYQQRNGEFGYFVHDWMSWLDRRFPCEEAKKESP